MRKNSLNSLARLLCLLFVFTASPAGAAGPAAMRTDPWTFSFYFENDLFSGTDQNYTNGTKISWISPDLTDFFLSGKLPDWSRPVINRLPFIHKKDYVRNVAISLGQNMYTPEDIGQSELVVADRPYGGWTYLGVGLHSKSVRRLDSMEIQMGLVGPYSLAEQTQTLVHELRGIQTPNGWDNQIGTEPGLALVYEWRQRLLPLAGRNRQGLGYDVITRLGGALGNVYTYGNLGLETRVGWNIPTDFGISLIKPAGDATSTYGAAKRFSFHLFGGIEGKAVARDIFLDGNTFAESHGMDKNTWVAEAVGGAALIVHGVKLAYAQVVRSREFEDQEGNHIFGSITLSWTF